MSNRILCFCRDILPPVLCIRLAHGIGRLVPQTLISKSVFKRGIEVAILGMPHNSTTSIMDRFHRRLENEGTNFERSPQGVYVKGLFILASHGHSCVRLATLRILTSLKHFILFFPRYNTSNTSVCDVLLNENRSPSPLTWPLSLLSKHGKA